MPNRYCDFPRPHCLNYGRPLKPGFRGMNGCVESGPPGKYQGRIEADAAALDDIEVLSRVTDE